MGLQKTAAFAVLASGIADAHGGLPAGVLLAPPTAPALFGNRVLKQAHRHEFAYEPRPGYLYVRSRAISSRCNDNYDEFPAEEIKAAYATFVGKPVFVNHHNANHRRARGVIIDAALHEDANPDGTPDTWVEVLMEVDAVRFPKLAEAVIAGAIDRTSMGTDVAYSVCTYCGNKAHNPAEYCAHIPRMKGQRITRRTASGAQEAVLVAERCYGLGFFENSLLVEQPADPTAFTFGLDTRGLSSVASLTDQMLRAVVAEAEDLTKQAWDEREHPRGHAGNPGEFRAKDTPASTSTPKAEMPHLRVRGPVSLVPPYQPKHPPTGTGTQADPIVTDDVSAAADALIANKYVRLSQPRVVSTLVEHLADLVDQAKTHGGRVHINLCLISVPKTNLFCEGNKGHKRLAMPQMKSYEVVPGSKAEQYGRPHGRQYDIQPAFRAMLQAEGVAVHDETVPAATLKATQSELDGAKVAGMLRRLNGGGGGSEEAIFVSKDGYILDGHHRWAAKVAKDAEDNVLGNSMEMPVHVIDLDIGTLYRKAMDFVQDWGIPTQNMADGPPDRKAAARVEAAVCSACNPFMGYGPDALCNAHGYFRKMETQWGIPQSRGDFQQGDTADAVLFPTYASTTAARPRRPTAYEPCDGSMGPVDYRDNHAYCPTCGAEVGVVTLPAPPRSTNRMSRNHVAWHRPGVSITHEAALGWDSLGKTADLDPVEVAGLAIQAADTGRILMIQRSFADKDDPARGTWEFPGGHLDDDEHPPTAALREFTEEVGCAPPHGDIVGSWRSGPIYQGFHMLVPTEGDVDIHCRQEGRATNPDDPHGDDLESVAWWLPEDAKKNPALRSEVKSGTDWAIFRPYVRKATAAVTATVLADAQAVGRALRAAGIPASKSSGTRVRGAPRLTPGYTAERYVTLDTKKTVVRVAWQPGEWAEGRTMVTSAEMLPKMASALEAAGFTVTRSGGDLHVVQDTDRRTAGWASLGTSPETAPDAETYGEIKKKNLGRCYELSAKRVAMGPDDSMPFTGYTGATLVHGSIQGFGQPRLDHAWVIEPDGRIWEPATATVYSPDGWQRLFNPQETVRYTAEQTRRQCATQKHWGPWDARIAKAAVALNYNLSLACGDEIRYVGSQPGQVTKGQDWSCSTHGDTKVADVTGPGTTDQGLGFDRQSSLHVGYGEQKAPAEVNTLREDACPVCGADEGFNGEQCLVCNYTTPPAKFADPDLDKAKQVDLRGGDTGEAEAGEQLVCPHCGATFTGSGEAHAKTTTDDDAASPSVAAAPKTSGWARLSAGNPFAKSDDSGEAKPKKNPTEDDAKKPPTKAPADERGKAPEAVQAGDTCPTCGLGTLEPAPEQPADGDPAGEAAQPDPTADGQPDPAGQDPAAAEGVDDPDADPDAPDEDDPADDDNPFVKKKKPKKGDPADDDDEDPSPFAKKKSTVEGARVDMTTPTNPAGEERRALLATVQRQQRQITALVENDQVKDRQIEALRDGLLTLASAAGVSGHAKFALLKTAEDENKEQVATTDEQALKPDAKDNVEGVGAVPAPANAGVTPDAVTDVQTSNVTLPTEPFNNLVDVTAPTNGTDTVPDNHVVTDVKAGNPSQQPFDNVGGWTAAKEDQGTRLITAMRLAKMRKAAGFPEAADADELALGEQINGDHSLPLEAMLHEVDTLSQVLAARTAQTKVPARNLVPQPGTRAMPSLSSAASAAPASVTPSASTDAVSSAEFNF